MDATLGEMAAAEYATAIIVAYVNLASFLVHGIELEAFIRECIGAHTDEACRQLHPASENQESRTRVAHLIDLYTTTALTSIRMVSHIQAALKNGMEWDEVTRMVRQHSALPDDDEIEAPLPDADHAGVDAGVTPARHAGTDGSDHLSEAEVAAKRRSVVMPILDSKRWSRGKWVTKAAVGKNCVYEYLKGKRNPGYENRQAMADALGLAVEDLPE